MTRTDLVKLTLTAWAAMEIPLALSAVPVASLGPEGRLAFTVFLSFSSILTFIGALAFAVGHLRWRCPHEEVRRERDGLADKSVTRCRACGAVV